jgi:hypothetical protein
VSYEADPERNLIERGASLDEIAFLRTSPKAGKRVELNALSGRRIIDWLEAKFDQHGVEKVIPDAETLVAAYRRAYRRAYLNDAIEGAAREAQEAAEAIEVPADLRTQVGDAFGNGRPDLAWDDVIAHLAKRARRLDGERRS